MSMYHNLSELDYCDQILQPFISYSNEMNLLLCFSLLYDALSFVKSISLTATLQQFSTVDGCGLFNVTLLFFKSNCNAPLNSIKLRMCNLIYIILIPLIAGFTRFTLKSLNRFNFKSIQQNFMVFAESNGLLTFSEVKY